MDKLKKIIIVCVTVAVLFSVAAVVMLITDGKQQIADEPTVNDQNQETVPDKVIYSTEYYEGDPALHLSYYMEGNEQANPVYADGTTLYTRIKITGSALKEEQIYNLRELQSLFEFNSKLGFYLEERGGDNTDNTYTGINLVKFLELAGLERTADGDTQIDFYVGSSSVLSMTWYELQNSDRIPLMVFGKNDYPLVADTSSAGYYREVNNQYGPIAFLLDSNGPQVLIPDVTKILVSNPGDTEDPNYGYHNRDAYLEMQNYELTVNVIDSDGNTETHLFTAKELEEFEYSNQTEVSGGYYATNGNLESLQKYGDVGGFMDYYEGLNLGWFLSEKIGISPDTPASAEFADRHGEWVASVDDIGYFWGNGESYDSYYTISRDNCVIYGSQPIIGIAKNGYPQLWEHEHDAPGALKYNGLNDRLGALDIESEVGVVQNVTGPFTICLPNCDGSYGGYQITTGASLSIITINLKG